MKAIQYPGIRIQQVRDAGTKAALLDLNSHLRSLYELYNAGTSTDHGPGLLRQVAPIVIPEVKVNPRHRSTRGVTGQLSRRGPDVFMKTGNSGEDTEWIQLPTGSAGFADPTGIVGLSPIDGTATTYMRSDAAPPLSQNISPTMTGDWDFQGAVTATDFSVWNTGITFKATVDASLVNSDRTVKLPNRSGIFAVMSDPINSGWDPTNVTTLKAFDADSITLNELADIVGTLISVLRNNYNWLAA